MSRPDPPIYVRAVPHNASATVYWEHPNNNGSPIYQYVVVSNPGNQYVVTPGVNITNIFGLENGVEYQFCVTAINEYGQSDATCSEPVIPVAKTLPSVPTHLRIYPRSNSLLLTWQNPETNGGEIVTQYTITLLDTGEQYLVSVNENGINTPVYNYTYLWTGLLNNVNYSFSISCSTVLGKSIDAFFSSASPSPVPYPPTNVTIQVYSNDKTTATVLWTPSLSDPRILDVTSYTIVAVPPLSNTPLLVSSTNTSWTFTNLNPEVAYTFYMYATNDAGNSDNSNMTLPNQYILDYRKPEYKPFVTGGNDPTMSSRMRYASRIGRLRKSQYVNYNSGAAFYT